MSGTRTGTVLEERVRRAERVPPVREGRISAAPDAKGRVRVTVRSLTGDVQRLGPCAGADAKVIPGSPITFRAPRRGDRCWVAGDEAGAGSAVIVAWEPVGA